MLYGVGGRQPIGGEFGVSARLISRYLEREDWETDAARLAQLQGTTLTAAVLNAVRAELSRREAHHRTRNEVQRMEEFARRISALPLLDNRSEDEILGYGPEGYPIGG